MKFKLKLMVIFVCCVVLIGGKSLSLSEGAPRVLAARSFVGVSMPLRVLVPSSEERAKHSFITKFAVFLFVSLWLYGCHKGGGSAPTTSASSSAATSNQVCVSNVFENQNQYQLCIKEHADWLVAQIIDPNDTSRSNLHGLVKSYESGSDPYVHVYDQAKAAMALLIADKKVPGNNYRQAAANILNALKLNLQIDASDPESLKGSFITAFHLTNPAQDLLVTQTGANAFVGLAINFYTQMIEEPETQFVEMREQLVNYLLSRVYTIGPDFNERAVINGDGRAFSAEENQAVSAFLNGSAAISFDPDYVDIALQINRFLRSLWNNEEGRFYRGKYLALDEEGNPLPITTSDSDGYPFVAPYQIVLDTGYSADVQTGMILVLGNNPGDFDYPADYTRAIDPAAPYSVKAQLQTQNANLPNGIAFSTETLYAGEIQNPDAEQTLRYVTALLVALKRYAVTGSEAPFALFWKLEAARQLLNAEELAVVSSPGQAIVHPATDVEGTHGGVFTVLAPRPNISPASGPSVAATSEMIYAKAGAINFYFASEAVDQLQQNFMIFVLAFFSTMISAFKQPQRRQGGQPLLQNSQELMKLTLPTPFETVL